MTSTYPLWRYYPERTSPPPWVNTLVGVFSDSQDAIDSAVVQGKQSDGVLAALRIGLEEEGYQVEAGKRAVDKIFRPVLFGDQGKERVHYEVDAWLADTGVLVEVEAGRGWMGNAFYRDLVRTSLIVDAKYLAIALMTSYRYQSGAKTAASHDYVNAHDQLDAIYASGRLHLPFEGVLLIGY